MTPPAPTDNPPTDSSLTSDELFTLLGNATRMSILETLWDVLEYERYVTATQSALSFEELRTRTATADSGNFNYHLEKLTDALVTKRPDGYDLTPFGYNVMRSITTYAVSDALTIPETELETPCPFCEAALTATYDRELAHTYCENCAGLSDGNLSFVHLPATGLQRTDIDGILDATILRLFHRIETACYGFCWNCHADVTPTVRYCPDHTLAEDGVCSTCDARFASEIEVACDECGSSGVGPLVETAIVSPDVRAHFERHGRGPAVRGPFRYRLDCLRTVTATTRREGEAVTYEFPLPSESLGITVRETNDGLRIQRNDRAEIGTRVSSGRRVGSRSDDTCE